MACAEVVVVPVEVGTLVIAVCAGQVVGFADGVACIFGGVKTEFPDIVFGCSVGQVQGAFL